MTASRARQIRAAIETASASLDDAVAVTVPCLYPAWEPGREHAAGDKLRYDNVLYRVLISHTSQSDWTPAAAVSLFARVLIDNPDDVPEWVQPGSTNPYMSGDRVTHGGKTWISTVDNNVWEPSVYGWDEV